MLALVMCLLVLGFAGAVVLRDAAHEWPSKRTATERARRRAHRREARPAPAATRAPAAGVPLRPLSPARRMRAGLLLVLSSIGIGVLAGVALGLVVVAVGLALRSI